MSYSDEPKTYSAVYDMDATVRIIKAASAKQWGRILVAGVQYGMTGAILVGLSALPWMPRDAYVEIFGSLAVAFILTLAWYLWNVLHFRKRVSDQLQRWECEMTPQAWSFLSKSGVKVSIPWSAMKVNFEHDEGWLINYDGNELVVYRRPLKQAGLDSEFYDRMTKIAT